MNTPFIRPLLLLFLITISTKSWTQHITGKIVDSDKNPLEYVSIAVLSPVDSILVSYDTTDENGSFKLGQIDKGKNLFQVHLVGYKTFQKNIHFRNEPINLGRIVLETENMLDEIVITAITPVSIKNDTISYDARAFRVRPDDSVEDLLKKLPDMEVDADGKVFAQGEQITRIYIDGKEFFSDDPSIAIKNLSADVIKKIEVIDEKTNQSRVSGVGSTDRPKAINIKLKDDHNINAFGKFQGGYGTDDRFLNSLNYNRFTPKFQASVIGKFNNVNSLGSDISELMTFNDGDKKKRLKKNNIPNSGFITTGIAGINLGYEFKKRQDLNVDYIYNLTDRNSGDVITKRTEFIKDVEIKSDRMSSNKSVSNNHKANFNYRDRSKKMSSFEFRGNVGSNDTEADGENSMDKYNGNGDLNLQSKGTILSTSKRKDASLRGEYVIRFSDSSKRNLQLAVNLSTNYLKSSNLNSQKNKYKIANPNQTYERKQEISKDQTIDNLTTNISFRYNEPLSDKHHLTAQGAIVTKIREKDVDQTKTIDDVVENPFIYELDYKNTDLSGGLGYKYDNKTLVLSSGATLLHQTIKFGLKDDVQYNNTYKYLLPYINARYKSSRGKFTMLRIRKSIITPSISQSSPVINDFNPLYLRQGNPYLTPSENYVFTGTVNRYYFSSAFSFNSRISYGITTNAIVNSETTDELGVRTTTFENYGDKKNFGVNLSFRKRIKPLGFRVNMAFGGQLSNYFSIINADLNETSTKAGNVRLSIENDRKKNIDATIGVFLNKNFTKFSSVQNVDRDFLQQTYYAKADWNITKRFNLNSQFKYDIYTDSNFETAQKIPIWNATLAYSFRRSKLMNIKFTALDILNKNIGLIRTSSDNYFQEIQREVLGTYYMLSLTFNLNSKKS